ncbi:probable guanine nucleotide exchange factor MCF2L2 isoform X6 [Dendropsophus ebraccatus]|uniref:probable guanine nucleotide exchange factor MCF2L2 isoform X6 n=1 Tax=Dendropsophus ebraccatus TaxID=150705 RepID=UPI0038322CC6
MLYWLREEEMSHQELTQRLSTVITHVDEIMQQEIRPLLAVDIMEQLHRQFATLPGGRGKDGAPIISFPEYPNFSEIPDDDFLNVVTYLTSIPSLEAASIGFIIIIDRRKDKWSSVKASLTRIAGAFPGNLQLVFILRPSRFIQRTIADIGIKLYRDDFKMKVPIIMINSVSDLHGYIDKSQLTSELGGTLEYSHGQWIQHRTAIESFAQVVKTTAQNLQTFGTSLAETELPNDVICTEELLLTHTEHQNKLKDDLKLAVQQGGTLLSCIKEPVSKDPSCKLTPDELENMATVERLLAQLDETEKAFNQFWSRHHLKLEQCLQLRHFEHDFRELKLTLDALMDTQASFTDIGDSVSRVEQLLKELKQQEEKGQGILEKAQLHALHGDQLIQNNHYAIDSIRPKCIELRRICDDFTNETKKKYDILGKSLELHQQLDKANQWCEDGIYLLASQAVDKCQSQDGAESALRDIEKFIGSSRVHQLSNPTDFYHKYEVILTAEIKASVQKVLQKLADVQEMFEKRQASLKKLAAKQTRPVQPVAPHPESSPKRASPKTTRPTSLATTRRTPDIPSAPPKSLSEADLSRKRNNKKAKGGIKIEVMHEASQGGTSRSLVMSESEENLCTRKSHIINELIETERVYVEELQSIIEGYASALENPEMNPLIPVVLQNNKDVLFGNLPEIYEFHKRTFLKELEKCIEDADSLGRCFLKRKEDLQIYEKYCQNKPRSEALWRQCAESIFFQASTVELKNLWVSQIRKVLTGQLEACREASQLHQRITESVYHAPMNSFSSRPNKTSLNNQNKAESASNNNKNRTSSPSGRQTKESESKEKEGARRFSLASSISSSAIRVPARTKGPLGPDVKVKRHEIKSDPTPLGLEDWPKHFNSLETYEDFSAIPSSNDELSNSDNEEETTTAKVSSLFCVESRFETCSPTAFFLQPGDVVQFHQCGENGQWLVKELVSKRKAWVPSSILTPKSSANVCLKDNSAAYSETSPITSVSTNIKEKQNEHKRSLVAEQKVPEYPTCTLKWRPIEETQWFMETYSNLKQ